MNNLLEKLKPSDGIGKYVKDFSKSDAPQFKGASASKRRRMAVAAYLSAKRKNMQEGKQHSWKTDGHYTKDGKEWKGPQHAHNGQVMTGEKHTEDSQDLFHFKDLKPNIRQKILDKLKENAEYDPTPGGMEWGTPKGTAYMKNITPGESREACHSCKGAGCSHCDYRGTHSRKIEQQPKFAEETEAAQTKHEYRKDNEANAPEPGIVPLTKDDIAQLEAELETMSDDDMEMYGFFDDDDDDEYDSDVEWDDFDMEEVDIMEVLSVQGRLKRRFAARKNRQKLKVARNIALRRGSSPDRLKKRATRGARSMVYKRLLKGRDKSQMPPAEKARLERLIGMYQPLIQRFAMRMLPKMRKMEINRMKNRQGKKPQKSKKYKAAKPIAKSSGQKAKKFKVKK